VTCCEATVHCSDLEGSKQTKISLRISPSQLATGTGARLINLYFTTAVWGSSGLPDLCRKWSHIIFEQIASAPRSAANIFRVSLWTQTNKPSSYVFVFSSFLMLSVYYISYRYFSFLSVWPWSPALGSVEIAGDPTGVNCWKFHARRRLAEFLESHSPTDSLRKMPHWARKNSETHAAIYMMHKLLYVISTDIINCNIYYRANTQIMKQVICPVLGMLCGKLKSKIK
jgi:hypothetical protein